MKRMYILVARTMIDGKFWIFVERHVVNEMYVAFLSGTKVNGTLLLTFRFLP